jgi:hypothetical protein
MVGHWAAESNSSADFMNHAAQHLTTHLSKPMFVEKSPTNVYSFSILASQHPEIPLIHIIRDGRDVAASLQKRGFNLFAAGTRWLFDTTAGLAGRQSPNYLEIFYEDLVKEPEVVLKRIFYHLGVDPEVDVLQKAHKTGKGVYQEDWKDRPEPRAWQQTPADPVSSASVGRYKEVFNEPDLHILERIRLNKKGAMRLGSGILSFKELLFRLGYQPHQYSVPVTSADRLRDILLQIKDYNRRLSRAHASRSWRLPPRFSSIAPIQRF